MSEDPRTEDGTRVALIVGATGTIGRSTVRSLDAAGATLALAGRDAERLAELAAGCRRASIHVVDARDIAAVGTLVDDVVATHGRLDAAASLVGSLLLKPAHLTSAEDWTEVLATNLTSAFALVRAAVPAMRGEGGAIVLTSTAAVRIGLANHEAIAAAKGGVEGLVRSAAATYGSRGIRVNAVAPGLVASGLTERLVADPTQAEASRRMHALDRLGTGEDVARAVAWLLDPAQSWVTGQVLGVDGGLGTVRTRPRA
ncbi:MAG: 3-oxoacyl-[acyl-carrier-protein] reductase FabG [Actinomycetota bacterium]